MMMLQYRPNFKKAGREGVGNIVPVVFKSDILNKIVFSMVYLHKIQKHGQCE